MTNGAHHDHPAGKSNLKKREAEPQPKVTAPSQRTEGDKKPSKDK
jgi:hypothetical protein